MTTRSPAHAPRRPSLQLLNVLDLCDKSAPGLAPLPLSEATLTRHRARVSVPGYDRAGLRRGVVHLGIGSFHRSHQAVYFDDLARRGLADGWAVTGVGLHNRDTKDVLDAQDGLYTVVSRGEDGDRARVVGIMTRYLFAPEHQPAVIEALADPATRLVTLTITAEGYAFDDEECASSSLGNPKALDLIVEALDRRRRRGLRPFTVLSCDNIPGNGSIARSAVIGIAFRRDPGLANWIARRAAFPSWLVDRIRATATDEHRRLVESSFGVRDLRSVVTEAFSQCTIEHNFCAGRPPLDRVGALFVAGVRP